MLLRVIGPLYLPTKRQNELQNVSCHIPLARECFLCFICALSTRYGTFVENGYKTVRGKLRLEPSIWLQDYTVAEKTVSTEGGVDLHAQNQETRHPKRKIRSMYWYER